MNAFEALGLNEQLVQSVTDLGFETPTEIQVKAIPVGVSNPRSVTACTNCSLSPKASNAFM